MKDFLTLILLSILLILGVGFLSGELLNKHGRYVTIISCNPDFVIGVTEKGKEVVVNRKENVRAGEVYDIERVDNSGVYDIVEIK